MLLKRYFELESSSTLELTEEEGWHFCPDWDYMLVGPDLPEIEGCTCRLNVNTAPTIDSMEG